ncbi:hypothetical protein LguiB_011442 [Lonicera macranthoides]
MSVVYKDFSEGQIGTAVLQPERQILKTDLIKSGLLGAKIDQDFGKLFQNKDGLMPNSAIAIDSSSKCLAEVEDELVSIHSWSNNTYCVTYYSYTGIVQLLKESLRSITLMRVGLITRYRGLKQNHACQNTYNLLRAKIVTIFICLVVRPP